MKEKGIEEKERKRELEREKQKDIEPREREEGRDVDRIDKYIDRNLKETKRMSIQNTVRNGKEDR